MRWASPSADSSRRELMAKPTENLAAYDEFLKGEAAAGVMKGDQASLRRAIAFYERAVALDSTFVQAWSQLSRARSSLYSNGVPDPKLGEQARLAAERARQLKPKDPSVYLAVGDYYGSVNPIDNERAVAAYEQGLRLAPDNVDLLGAAAMHRDQPGTLGRCGGAARARLAPGPTLGEHRPPAVGGAHLSSKLSRRGLRRRPGDRAGAGQSGMVVRSRCWSRWLVAISTARAR